MAGNANKTEATEVSVAEFIAAVPDERRRSEAGVVDALLRRITGEDPRMWGPTIIGYGSYDYTYDSGHSGTSCRIGFSPRKAQLVVYLIPVFEGPDKAEADRLLARLGPHSLGKSCLYIRRLDKIDRTALEQLLALSWRLMGERYPA